MTEASAPPSPRHVLMIIADDWSPLAGCYGTPGLSTPHIDAFAATALRFDRAYCTAPTCAASRACILTGLQTHTHGQYGHCHGIHGFRTHAHIDSLPRQLAASPEHFGGLIGKNHTAPASVYPWEFEFSNLASTDNMHHVLEMTGALRRFHREAGDRSTFLMLAPGYPHRAGDSFGNKWVFPGTRPTAYDPARVHLPAFLPDLPEVRAELADYYDAISRFDQCVGAVLAALEESGRADETLVLLLSDHGLPFAGAKASSFEDGHRCPLLLRAPGASGSTSVPVTWADLYPTLRETLRLPEPADGLAREGQSLLPALPGRERIFASHCFHEITNYFPYRILWEGRHKYIRHYAAPMDLPIPADIAASASWRAVREAGDALGHPRNARRIRRHDPEALFDLAADPLEEHNLLHDPAQAPLLQRLRAEMDAFQRRTRDPWLDLSLQSA